MIPLNPFLIAILIVRQVIGWIIVLIAFIILYIGMVVLPPNDKTWLMEMMEERIEITKQKIRRKTWTQ